MSMSALGSWQKISGSDGSGGERTSLLSVNLTRSLAKNSTISSTLRTVKSHGVSEPTRETALTFNINVLF
jgi:hypothetical protein